MHSFHGFFHLNSWHGNLTARVLAGDLSSDNVTVVVIAAISNKLPWKLGSGAMNQFTDCDTGHTQIDNHRATTTNFSSKHRLK
jgi:hypothetical protein